MEFVVASLVHIITTTTTTIITYLQKIPATKFQNRFQSIFQFQSRSLSFTHHYHPQLIANKGYLAGDKFTNQLTSVAAGLTSHPLGLSRYRPMASGVVLQLVSVDVSSASIGGGARRRLSPRRWNILRRKIWNWDFRSCWSQLNSHRFKRLMKLSPIDGCQFHLELMSCITNVEPHMVHDVMRHPEWQLLRQQSIGHCKQSLRCFNLRFKFEKIYFHLDWFTKRISARGPRCSDFVVAMSTFFVDLS